MASQSSKRSVHDFTVKDARGNDVDLARSLKMGTKLLALACIRKESYGDLSPRPHYPSMPKYPKGVTSQETSLQGSEAKAMFSVMGMTCSACAGSVEGY
ncbi:hypothetical protein ES332_D08G227400v1 [Gossypium tomentosum]|uniref:Uncharacterized protein n=1 Tax=Gossypium tomentosum TaxID=34277 RepID=A0A5D2JXE8_GOSTO|nr:hypothetical protein ES332_D08G227400v1 [Gossypium tomentosum]